MKKNEKSDMLDIFLDHYENPDLSEIKITMDVIR